jgi:anaerobic ribonucleoside-triphosphate reductase activating protein
LYGLLKQIDYIVVGPFIEEQKDLSLLWRGSRNQEVIDVQQTLKNQKKTLFVL